MGTIKDRMLALLEGKAAKPGTRRRWKTGEVLKQTDGSWKPLPDWLKMSHEDEVKRLKKQDGSEVEIHYTHVRVKDPMDRVVGAAKIAHEKDGSIGCYSVSVVPELRRMGVATNMYVHAEKVTGKKLVPTTGQKPDGAALWKANKKGKWFGHNK